MQREIKEGKKRRRAGRGCRVHGGNGVGTEMSGYWQTPWLTGLGERPSNEHVVGHRNMSNHNNTAKERHPGS